MKEFGNLKDGRKCYLYELENDKFILKVTNYGATLVSFIVKENNVDVVQGFDDVRGYVEDVPYMGGSIGRVCNRTGNGKCSLNNIDYNVTVNNGPNSLHGGEFGFDKQIWNIKKEDNKLICTYFSKDNEEGYPGNLKVKVTYTLLDDGFGYEYEGISDKDTIFSMTNHAFFNFNGPGSISVLDHEVMCDVDKVAKVDKDGLTLNETFDVTNTPFDFRSFKSLGKNIEDNNEQIINGNGYDHHFIVKGDSFRKMVTCKANDITMSVYSDLPGFHMYSGNFLDGNARGKDNGTFPRRSAVCFETQFYPNAINYSSEVKPILKANEIMKHRTEFIFNREG